MKREKRKRIPIEKKEVSGIYSLIKIQTVETEARVAVQVAAVATTVVSQVAAAVVHRRR